MIPRKLVEIAFRRLWILVLPIVAIPIAAVLLADRTAKFESSAVVWVASPPPGTPTLGHYSVYLSPAQNQAIALNDLLATKSFKEAIAAEASAETSHPELRSPTASFTAFAVSNGVNLLTVRARAGDPADAQALVRATIAEFERRSLSQVERTSGLSEEYYGQQLALAQEELDKRRKAVDEYVKANPAVAKGEPSAVLNLDYRALVARVDQQGEVVAELQKSLQQVKLNLISAPQGQQAAFSVQDEPDLPEGRMRSSIMKTFGFPVAGMVLGILLSATYLYVTYRTDHTIQSSEEIAALGVPVLGKVPELHAGRRLSWAMPPWQRMRSRRRGFDFARQTAASISSEPATGSSV